MRIVPLAVLLILLTASADAQDAAVYPVPTTGQRTVLVVGAVIGLLPAPVLGPFAMGTVAALTYLTSASLGLRPTLAGVVLDTAVGTGVAIVVATATASSSTERPERRT